MTTNMTETDARIVTFPVMRGDGAVVRCTIPDDDDAGETLFAAVLEARRLLLDAMVAHKAHGNHPVLYTGPKAAELRAVYDVLQAALDRVLE